MMMKSLKNINYRLFLSLLVIGFVPSVYTTVRIYFMGDFRENRHILLQVSFRG